MSLLNRMAYVVEKDRLIYDAKHPIDATAVSVTTSSIASGVLRRGQLLDCTDGVYSIHAEGGTASVIVAKDTECASDEGTVIVPVYTSGSFRSSAVITDPAITAADVEALRGGIYLK